MPQVEVDINELLAEIESVGLSVDNDSVRVEGWIYCDAEPWVLLQCAFENQSFVLAQQSLRRDLVGVVSEKGHAAFAGFYVDLPIPTQEVPEKLFLIAHLSSGLTASLWIELTATHRSKIVSSLATNNSSHSLSFDSQLNNFLELGELLSLPTDRQPEVSVIIPTYNSPSYLLACLKSLVCSQSCGFEVIVVDNASSDETVELLSKVRGAEVIRTDSNLHYLPACNLAARSAKGRYLLFANDDVIFSSQALVAAIGAFSSGDVGAVGGRIIQFDGRLQEAGSVIAEDGSTHAIGRGEDPWSNRFLYRREVDYCSGVFLMTPRKLFIEQGGYSEIYSPSYYEDVDYCVRLRELGLKVLYEPAAVVHHKEHASSNLLTASRHQKVNRLKFNQRYAGSPNLNINPAKKVLFIDDKLPLQKYGSGFPRTHQILSELVSSGVQVSLYCLRQEPLRWQSWYSELPPEIECIVDGSVSELGNFLTEAGDKYCLIIVSRPQNLEHLQKIRSSNPKLFGDLPVIYDAEAIVAYREIQKAKLHRGIRFSAKDESYVLDKELSLLKDVTAALAVSKPEAELIETHTSVKSLVVSHCVESNNAAPPFEDRFGVLMVGPLLSLDTPNADAVRWFLESCMPLFKERLPNTPVRIVGQCIIPEFINWNDPQVSFLGFKEDLSSFYDQARVFVAATRFSAGIPLKVLEASGHGLPCVTTPLLAEQLNWSPGKDLMAAENPNDFVDAIYELHSMENSWDKVRRNALMRIERECSVESFRNQMKPILDFMN